MNYVSEYTVIILFIPGLVNNKPALASITHQLHIVDDLQAKVLIGMDILGPEQVIIDAGYRKSTSPLYRNLQANLTITPTHCKISRIVLADQEVIVPANSVTTILIQLKATNKLPADQDFLFQPTAQELKLGPQGRLRTHVVDSNFTFIEIQNATNQPVALSRKMQLGRITDYKEKGCYAVSTNKTHLAAGAQWSKQAHSSVEKPDAADLTEKHAIGFTAYGLKPTHNKRFAAAEAYQIRAETGGFMDVP